MNLNMVRLEQLLTTLRGQLKTGATNHFYYKNLQQMIAQEWFERNLFQQHQLKMIESLLQFSFKQSDRYQRILLEHNFDPSQPLSEEIWQTLPILRRDDLVTYHEQIKTKTLPSGHGKVSYLQTSGSTGKPVTGLSTEYNKIFSRLNILREHIWHQRDFSGRFAAIRPDRISFNQREMKADSWGKPVNQLFNSGASAILHSSIPVDEQLQWLQKIKPAYLLTLPSNLKELNRLSLATNQLIPSLVEVRTYGETVSEELRKNIQSDWQVPLKDMYSSTEAGYFAIQCQIHEHYHIVADTCRVEILNEDNQLCKPGEIGRVIVTPLHNYAFPLLRYDIGDYAEQGDGCDCGCQFSVIKKVMGRSRNMLQTPDGRCWWPSFPAEHWAPIASVQQIQIIQDQLDHVRVNLVVDKPMTNEQQIEFTKVLHKSLNYPFKVDYCYLKEIPRNKNCKFEDFISEIK